MRSPHLALGVLALTASGLTLSTCHAQTDKPEASPYAFSIRTYPLPSWELGAGFESKDKGQLSAPKMPPSDANAAELEAFLKRSHEVVKEYLLTQEIPLPPGSLACYDAATATLSLRTMEVVHEMVGSLSSSSVQNVPKHLSWRLEIVEAPSADVRAAMKQCQGKAEHGRQLDDLMAKGVSITTMRGETKGGQQTSTRQGIGFNRPVGYIANAAGLVQTESEWANSGVLFELDPVIGEEGSIDINLHLQYWPTAPQPRLAQLTAGSAPKVEAEWLDLPAFTTKLNSTFQSGGTRLLGLWDLDTLGDPAKAGRCQAAFLCAHTVRLLPSPELRLEALLRERGEAIVPTPEVGSTVINPLVPPGMMIRRFKVPPDFETMSGAPDPASPADPFAPGAASANEPRPVRRTLAQEILKGQGIPFPPGAYARFLPGTSELVVCNLPENLELVVQFTESILICGGKMAQFTVEIIEADATLLRRLVRESEALTDHSAALRTLEAEIATGKAKVFRSAWIETKGGQQATWGNVILTKTISEFGFLSASPPDSPKKEGESEATEPAPKTRHPELFVHSEEERIGFEVEVDPVIGENNTVDLNLSMRVDTAPIGTLSAAAKPSPDTQRLATVNTVTRNMEMKTSISLVQGVPRLLNLYQPTTAEGSATQVLHAVFVRADLAASHP